MQETKLIQNHSDITEMFGKEPFSVHLHPHEIAVVIKGYIPYPTEKHYQCVGFWRADDNDYTLLENFLAGFEDRISPVSVPNHLFIIKHENFSPETLKYILKLLSEVPSHHLFRGYLNTCTNTEGKSQLPVYTANSFTVTNNEVKKHAKPVSPVPTVNDPASKPHEEKNSNSFLTSIISRLASFSRS